MEKKINDCYLLFPAAEADETATIDDDDGGG